LCRKRIQPILISNPASTLEGSQHEAPLVLPDKHTIEEKEGAGEFLGSEDDEIGLSEEEEEEEESETEDATKGPPGSFVRYCSSFHICFSTRPHFVSSSLQIRCGC
jgi:hypothetical protein